mgnify:CR=1 FL=1
MIQDSKIIFSPIEITEILIKSSEIHMGFWQMFIESQLLGAPLSHKDNLLLPIGEMLPTLILKFPNIGIKQVPEGTKSAVNATLCNPVIINKEPKAKQAESSLGHRIKGKKK